MSNTSVLFSGIPGRMASEVALAVLKSSARTGLSLAEIALTDESCPYKTAAVGEHEFTLVKPSQREALDVPAGTIAVDFTWPESALVNIEYFTSKKIPFVIGTTGYDQAKARAMVEASGVPAVIAPNMAIPIVLMQIALDYLAANFPGALAGYQFSVSESHQSTKKDTSGTAKAVVGDFAKLGLPITTDQIQMIRDPKTQTEQLGVPEEFLTGHAYHYYEMTSESGDVRMKLSHEINGRGVYTHGSVTAVEFLSRRMAEGVGGKVFTMMDVMRDMQ